MHFLICWPWAEITHLVSFPHAGKICKLDQALFLCHNNGGSSFRIIIIESKTNIGGPLVIISSFYNVSRLQRSPHVFLTYNICHKYNLRKWISWRPQRKNMSSNYDSSTALTWVSDLRTFGILIWKLGLIILSNKDSVHLTQKIGLWCLCEKRAPL